MNSSLFFVKTTKIRGTSGVQLAQNWTPLLWQGTTSDSHTSPRSSSDALRQMSEESTEKLSRSNRASWTQAEEGLTASHCVLGHRPHPPQPLPAAGPPFYLHVSCSCHLPTSLTWSLRNYLLTGVLVWFRPAPATTSLCLSPLSPSYFQFLPLPLFPLPNPVLLSLFPH